jgi:hypothetical protein
MKSFIEALKTNDIEVIKKPQKLIGTVIQLFRCPLMLLKNGQINP